MKRATWILAVLALLLGSVEQAKADYVYVGSWDLATIGGGYSNPSNPFIWANNPQVYSGVEAAAMLFGGSASEYAISTVDSNPADINFKAFVDGYGNTEYLSSPASDTYSLSSNGGGYDNYPSFSAYVVDHAPLTSPYHFVNYAFREENAPLSVVPAPSSIALLGIGIFSLVGFALRRRLRVAA